MPEPRTNHPRPPLQPLPVDAYIPRVAESLADVPSLVLVAEPGAGKTTRVAPALLDQPWAAGKRVLMLQPRRIAARTSAERIAFERGCALGQEVGYHVRLDRRTTAATRLVVMTEGILARQLLADPYIEDVAAVVLDEFHERSIHTDLALALTRELQQTVRPDLRVVVMSATLDAGPICQYLATPRGPCPMLDVPGRTYPVEVRHLSPQQAAIAAGGAVVDAAIEGIRIAMAEPGDILCFLPGAGEIRRVQQWVETAHPEVAALPLYGALTAEQQQLAVRRQSRPPARRVILSTNVAETSLTIEGVRIVVDTGYARVARYDPHRGLDNLTLERISLASARQRAGRAGRTEPGICIRLWTARQEADLAPHPDAEIHRVDLAPTLLTLAALGTGDPRHFDFFQPPDPATIHRGWSLLARLGLVTEDASGQAAVTTSGKAAAALGVHPRLARLMLEARNSGEPLLGAALAALLSEPDILREGRHDSASEHGPSDLSPRLAAVRGDAAAPRPPPPPRDIDPAALARVRQLAKDLAGNPAPLRWDADAEDRLLPRLALAAYPDRVCLRRETDRFAGRMVGSATDSATPATSGVGVRLAASSRVQAGPYFVAVDLRDDDRQQRREALVAVAQSVSLDDIGAVLPHRLRPSRETLYDAAKDRVVCRQQLLLDDLPLQSSDDGPIDPDAAAACLAQAVRPRISQLLAANEHAASLIARLTLARQHLPELDWPPIELETLSAEAIEGLCRGHRSLAQVGAADLKGWLLGLMPWNLQQTLAREVPDAIEVPSGRSVKIEYAAGRPPVLAVRLQEMFGCRVTPAVARGRVPVVIHLLSPGYKPVQVTQDLASFWANTYQQVRKDLRARYPKHAWPEDPHGATAVARGPSQKRT